MISSVLEDCRNLEEEVAVLRSTIGRSEKDLEVVEQKLASRKQSLDKCEEVEEIQISLEDLRTLKNIVLESAAANSLDREKWLSEIIGNSKVSRFDTIRMFKIPKCA
jgi:hypothetical protein